MIAQTEGRNYTSLDVGTIKVVSKLLKLRTNPTSELLTPPLLPWLISIQGIGFAWN
jgi:hypothetical protein